MEQSEKLALAILDLAERDKGLTKEALVDLIEPHLRRSVSHAFRLLAAELQRMNTPVAGKADETKPARIWL